MANGTVLFVDDEENILHFLKRVFIDESYEILTATNGEDALEILQQQEVHVVLLDIMMPGLDGYETCKRIKSHAKGRLTQVILVSGDGSIQAKVRGYDVSADDYVVKPFINKELLAKVRVQFRLRAALVKLEEQTTELVKANEILQATEANLQTIITQNADGIIIVDRNGIIRFANPAAESLFGRKTEELFGDAFGFAVVGEETARIEVMRRDSETVVAEMRTVGIKWEGEAAHLISIRDISERKKAEDKIKEAIAIKAEFISMASHELRTPLAAMKESIRLVITEQTGELNDEQKEFLGIAKRNVDRLARLINDILDFQKLDAGKVEFDLQKNDMNEVVREIEEAMIPLANEKGLSLMTELDDNMPRIKFDRDKITQVLTNIVNNAVKFTEQGNITITTAKDGNIVRVTVQDTGPGIKETDLPKLFQEFVQISTGNRTKMGSSGLGLAISEKIINEHNGKIWAESEFGKGTSLHFVLPIEELAEIKENEIAKIS